MTLEQQVVSLELAKKLKELGVKQESEFYWKPRTTGTGHPSDPVRFLGDYLLVRKDEHRSTAFESYSAFTVAELGEILPFNYITRRNGAKWYSHEFPFEDLAYSKKEKTATTEADARAKMLICLVENNLIQLQ